MDRLETKVAPGFYQMFSLSYPFTVRCICNNFTATMAALGWPHLLVLGCWQQYQHCYNTDIVWRVYSFAPTMGAKGSSTNPTFKESRFGNKPQEWAGFIQGNNHRATEPFMPIPVRGWARVVKLAIVHSILAQSRAGRTDSGIERWIGRGANVSGLVSR